MTRRILKCETFFVVVINVAVWLVVGASSLGLVNNSRADTFEDPEGDAFFEGFSVKAKFEGPRPPHIRWMPRPVTQPLPQYPVELRRIWAVAIVRVDVKVDCNGAVTYSRLRMNVGPATAEPAFRQAVEEALRQWRFKPAIALNGGKPVDINLHVMFSFELEPGWDAVVIPAGPDSKAKRFDPAG